MRLLKIFFFAFAFLLITSTVIAQSSISQPLDTTYINPSDSVDHTAYYTDSLSNPVDMWEGGSRKRLTGVQIDSTMDSDTIFIQTAEYYKPSEADTIFNDAYYTKSDGTQVQMFIPITAAILGKRVGINPLWADILSRFVRFRSNSAETSEDRKIVPFGN